MKARLLLPFAVSVLFTFCAISTHSQTVITFDDLHETGSGSFIRGTYQGLTWSNFGCLSGILNPTDDYPHLTNGFYYGVVSVSNVAVNAGGQPAQIDSVADFNFLSAYLTGGWHSNLSIEVQGFRGGISLYDTTVVASATSPTLFTFDYLNVDRLYFNSFGGEVAFGFDGGNQFAMDNFTFEFVPEPSTLLLTGAGVLTLCALRKRRRA